MFSVHFPPRLGILSNVHLSRLRILRLISCDLFHPSSFLSSCPYLLFSPPPYLLMRPIVLTIVPPPFPIPCLGDPFLRILFSSFLPFFSSPYVSDSLLARYIYRFGFFFGPRMFIEKRSLFPPFFLLSFLNAVPPFVCKPLDKHERVRSYFPFSSIIIASLMSSPTPPFFPPLFVDDWDDLVFFPIQSDYQPFSTMSFLLL